MKLDNISKINSNKKTLSKIDCFLSVVVIVNLIVTFIAIIIDRTTFFPEIEPQPIFDINNIIVVIILPITFIIKKLINNKIKKIEKNII